MTIVEKNGRYHARHVTKGEVPETAGESELHKALKNHTAETASRDGFGVTVEDRAVHGRRRTDVTVAGASGKKIGYEIQISPIASGSVGTRTHTAVDDGLIPLWLVTNENSLAIDRAPWARLNVQRWQDVGSRDALRVRGEEG
ncbi:competence protein CoiA family protein [Streptomyces viridiviolaceus]